MQDAVVLKSAVKKLHVHLLPCFLLVVLFCYLDRTALAFAALQLCHLQWYSPALYGLGSGIFYAGYVLCQIPSTFIMTHVGPSIWLPIIMLTWGALAAACAAISGPATFVGIRLLLGIAESGAFPTMWYTLSLYYPSDQLTVPYSALEATTAVSQVLSAPLAAGILSLHNIGNLEGWQWLFLAEGLPCVFVAVALFFAIPKSLSRARFLSPEEKKLLHEVKDAERLQSSADQRNVELALAYGTADQEDTGLLQAEHERPVSPVDDSQKAGHRPGTTWVEASYLGDHKRGSVVVENQDVESLRLTDQRMSSSDPKDTKDVDGNTFKNWQRMLVLAVTNKKVLYLGTMKAIKDFGYNILLYWTPLLISSLLTNDKSKLGSGRRGSHHCGDLDHQIKAALLAVIPYACAVVVVMVVGHSSQKYKEERLHLTVTTLLAGTTYFLIPMLVDVSTVLVFVLLCFVVSCSFAMNSMLPAMVHKVCGTGPHAAIGQALGNSMGNIGSLLGPYVFGLGVKITGGYKASLFLAGVVMYVGAAMAYFYKPPREREGKDCKVMSDSPSDSPRTPGNRA